MKQASLPRTSTPCVSPEKRRDQTIDFFRGLLVVGVIAIHVEPLIIAGSPRINTSILLILVLHQFFHCSVPGFLFLSGYVNARGYARFDSGLAFYRRRFRSVLIPYIAVSVFYLLWAQFPGSHLGPMPSKPGALLSLFFLKGADFHLYFVPVLVQCYILFPFIYKYCVAGNHSRRNRLSLFLGLAGLHILFGLLAYHHIVPYLLARNSFIFWGVYFYAGMMLGFGGTSGAQIRRWRNLTACLALVAAVLFYYAITSVIGHDGVSHLLRNEMRLGYVRPIMLAFDAVCIGVIALRIRTGPEISQRFFCWLGRNSLQIFLWHLVALRVMLQMTPIGYLCLLHPVLLPAVIFSTAIIVALVYEAWRKGRRFITKRLSFAGEGRRAR